MTKFKDHLCRHDSCTLCSAAPDLLEAAKIAEGVISSVADRGGFTRESSAESLLEHIRKAIAAAEGK